MWRGRRLHMSGRRQPTESAAWGAAGGAAGGAAALLCAARSTCSVSTGFTDAPQCWVFRVGQCHRGWSAEPSHTEFKCGVLSLGPPRQLWKKKSALLCRHLAAAGGCRTPRGTAESRLTWWTTGGGLRGVGGGASVQLLHVCFFFLFFF